ncbi:MAG: ribonuclease E [Myxococcota bacterium]
MPINGTTLLVNSSDAEEVRVATILDGQLIDVRTSRPDHKSIVGNIYLAEVTRVEAGLDAAFVVFDDRKVGFLHLGNIHPAAKDFELSAVDLMRQIEVRPESENEPITEDAAEEVLEDISEDPDPQDKINEFVYVGRKLLVQVLRDPVGTKGATLSTYVSLAGSFVVLMPSLDRIGISRRIEDETERQRLRDDLSDIVAESPLPVIARTAAMDEPKKVLRADFRRLERRWQTLLEMAAKADSPGLVLEEESPAVRAVRELFHGGLEKIVVDEPAVYEELEVFLKEKGATGARVELSMHEKSMPLFESMIIEEQYQRLFRQKVPLGKGASLVIQQTEALVAIDVNSGRLDAHNLEDTAFETNMLAAKEIARQTRLRDLGGIIVVDFIDMRNANHRREVESSLRSGLMDDRARMKCGHIGSFGLMSFTRRRTGNGPLRPLLVPCRSCAGTGHRAQLEAAKLRVIRKLRAVTEAHKMFVRAHPSLVALMKRDTNTIQPMGHQVEWQDDIKVPIGEPIIQVQQALAE